MKTASRLIGSTFVLLLASVVMAQAPGFRGPPPGPPPGMDGPPPLLILVTQRPVQNELKLSAEQRKKINDTWVKQMTEMRTLMPMGPEKSAPRMKELTTEGDRAVNDALKSQQQQRLREISWQLQGGAAFADPEVVKELQLTTEQQQDISVAREKTKQQVGKLFQGPPANPELVRRKMVELNKKSAEEIKKLLTDEQKAKWKVLIGKAFTADVRLMPPMPPLGPPPGAAPR